MKKDSKIDKKRSKFFDKILLAAGIVFIGIFCMSGYMLLKYYGEYREQKKLDESIAGLRQAEAMDAKGDSLMGNSGNGEKEQKDNSRLKEINADYIGFITIPDTNVYYPVVRRDNSYYLYHDFMGEKNSHGTIFMDEGCEPEDTVVLIHGHHMKDGTMFGPLKNFKKKEFREEHEILYLDWGEGDQPYEIFAAALIDLTQEDYFTYEVLPATEEETKRYLKELKQNSFYFRDLNKVEQGQIVLLSTCEYGTEQQRLVIAAVSKNRGAAVAPEEE